VKDGSTDEEKDFLYAWIKEEEVKAAILLEEEVDPELVARVINEGYAPDLTDDEVLQIGRDLF
jgi:2-keto-4-pentenoate hydratase